MPRIITPNELEANSVVPACLDNQYVDSDTFTQMRRESKGYAHSEIVQRRGTTTHREVIRSLLYARTTVVNRAYFTNNPYLYRYYEDSDLGRAQGDAFAELMRDKAIVPWLMHERELSTSFAFSTDRPGQNAVRRLLELTRGDYVAVRFSNDDAENKRNLLVFYAGFSGALTKIKAGGQGLIKLIFREIAPYLPPERFPDRFAAFTHQFAAVAQTAFDGVDGNAATRETLYQTHLVRPADNAVADGLFLPYDNGQDDFSFEIKSLIDLAYNANLADALGRYYLAPSDLPGRSALGDQYEYANDSNLESFEKSLGQDLMEQLHGTAVALPSFDQLRIVDVLRLRNTLAWAEFNTCLGAVLADPLRAAETLPTLNEAYLGLLQGVHDYAAASRQELAQERCSVAVKFCLEFGGALLVLTNPAPGSSLDEAIGLLAQRIPERVREVAVRILFAVVRNGEVDPERSHSVEVARHRLELTRSEVVGILRDSAEKSDFLVSKPVEVSEQDVSAG